MNLSLATRPHRTPPTAPAAARTLLDVFSTTALRFRPRIAIDAPDEQLTYAELSVCARHLGDRLRALGIGPGDRVGVYVASGCAPEHSHLASRRICSTTN
jgi:non-ribosomal peptide synthetase component E (peptide arylation enzyme)